MEFNEDDKETQKKIHEVIVYVAQVIESKAKEHCKYKNDQKNFVLAAATNLLGNLAMHWSDDSIQAKVVTSTCTIENLMNWYKIAFIEYGQRKDMH